MDDKEKYLLEQQKKYEARFEICISQGNKVFQELVKQLILVATVFISVSGFIFRTGGKTSLLFKHILVFSWLLLGCSIVFGIVQYFIDYLFFGKWAKANHELAKGLALHEIDSPEKLGKISTEKQNLPTESSTFVWLQVIFLLLGICLLIIAMAHYLFVNI